MPARIHGIVILCAVLGLAVPFPAGSARGGNPAGTAGGSRMVTFYVA